MKSLRIIGGPANGKRIVLQDGCDRYVVREHSPMPMRMFDVAAPVMCEYRETLYVIDSVQCSGDTVEFLRPAAWSTIYRSPNVVIDVHEWHLAVTNRGR